MERTQANGKRHYHVLHGLRGYMPNVNDYCATLKDAEAVAIFWARDFRVAGYTVTGSARNRWYDVSQGQYIEIVDCSEEDCSEDDGY